MRAVHNRHSDDHNFTNDKFELKPIADDSEIAHIWQHHLLVPTIDDTFWVVCHTFDTGNRPANCPLVKVQHVPNVPAVHASS
jgi:hypothetical protein